MKIIDLLNKIANGEIDINNKYQFSRDDYCTINDFFARYIVDEKNLNLEIIEKKKIPEKLEILNANEHSKEVYYENYSKEEISLDIETLQHWVNKIIDYLDYLKSKGE